MSRLIDAEALKATIRAKFEWISERCEINNLINAAPTVDAVPVTHGRWVTRRAGLESYPHWDSKCSACGYKVAMVPESWLYCPHCGARMDGGEDDDKTN